MIEFGLLSLGLGIVVVLGLAFVIGRSGVASDTTGIFGIGFIAPDQTARPRGVQEGDLPRFVFKGSTPVPC